MKFIDHDLQFLWIIHNDDQRVVTKELKSYDRSLVYFITCDICHNIYKVIRKGKIIVEVDCSREDNQEDEDDLT